MNDERYISYVMETCFCCGRARLECLPQAFSYEMWVSWGRP